MPFENICILYAHNKHYKDIITVHFPQYAPITHVLFMLIDMRKDFASLTLESRSIRQHITIKHSCTYVYIFWVNEDLHVVSHTLRKSTSFGNQFIRCVRLHDNVDPHAIDVWNQIVIKYYIPGFCTILLNKKIYFVLILL